MIFDLFHIEIQRHWSIYSISFFNIELKTQFISLLELSLVQGKFQGDFLFIRGLLRKLLA